MDNKTVEQIVYLYNNGNSIRDIAAIESIGYKRENIRKELKKTGIIFRGRGIRYENYQNFEDTKAKYFAELLGYLYGDGSLCKCKSTQHGLYECYLVFSLNETDLVKRASEIIEKLFQFKPIIKEKENFYIVKVRKSLARYLYNVGYPCGKKSAINPHVPFNLLKSNEMKQSFIRGFLNAEATVNKSVSVQQSVRVNLSRKEISTLKKQSKGYKMRYRTCHFITWSIAKNILKNKITQPNILIDLKKTLLNYGLNSSLYPIRVYIGQNTSIHYELRLYKNDTQKLIELNLLSCRKKVDRLTQLLQG